MNLNGDLLNALRKKMKPEQIIFNDEEVPPDYEFDKEIIHRVDIGKYITDKVNFIYMVQISN